MTETQVESPDEHIDVGEYLNQILSDPNWEKENAFPRIYRNLKTGDLVLKKRRISRIGKISKS